MKTLKKADSGSQSTSFEQSFSNLAHAYLQDKAPGLTDYEVGFQLLDRNQENTKAVGVFGFQVGSQWLLAPVFFLNGDLKGHELLYLKNEDVFVPLKENWLNYILNKKPHVLGKGVDKNLGRIGVLPPNLYQLSRSPNKFASVANWPTWAQAAATDIGHFVTVNPFDDSKYKDLTDLPKFMKDASEQMFKTLLTSMQEYPKLAEGIANCYGLSFIDEIADKLSKQKKEANAVIRPITKQSRSAAGDNVHVITDKETGPGGKQLSMQDKEVLLRERIIIKDERKDGDVSIAYDVQTRINLFNPDHSGLYDILVRPGKFEKCLVITGAYSPKGRKQFATVIRVDSPKAWLNIHPSYIWARIEYGGQEWTDWFNSQPDADELEVGDHYVLFNEKGEGTVPCEVERSVGAEDGSKTYEVYAYNHAEKERSGFLPHQTYHSFDRDTNYGSFGSSYVTLTGRQGAHIYLRMGTIYIPKGFKYFKCKDDKPDENDRDHDMPACCGTGSSPPGIEPGDLVDAQLMLFSKLASLDVRHSGPYVQVNDKEFEPTEALIHLVKQHGLREKQARTILKEARQAKHKSYYIKYAGPYDLLNQGPHAPPIPEPYMGMDPMSGANMPTMFRSEFNIPIPDLMAQLTDRSMYMPMGPNPKYGPTGPDKDTMDTVMQAMNSKQREVFDTSMLASLLKATRDDSMIERYMGDLTKGMDRIGRILFSFYWHQDQFESRYGKGDMPELEDSLRNAFESVGDIILFLKQKSVKPTPEQTAAIDLSATADS